MITFPQVGDEMVSKFPQLKGLIKSSQVQIRREFSRFFFFFFWITLRVGLRVGVPYLIRFEGWHNLAATNGILEKCASSF